MTEVHARNEVLSRSSKQTDIATNISMFCALRTPFHMVIFSRIQTSIVRAPLCTSVLQGATHCCPTASTVCAACTLGEPQNSLPKNGHEHYHGSLKHCMHNFTRQYWLFGLLHGGVASLGHIFKIHLSPDQSSYIGLFLRLASFWRARTMPAPIPLKFTRKLILSPPF
jgi:hypothetical protein